MVTTEYSDWATNCPECKARRSRRIARAADAAE